jgi:glycosyltransferase involved in cell wall biosynthesis
MITYLISDTPKSIMFEQLFIELINREIIFKTVLILNEKNSNLKSFCLLNNIECDEIIAKNRIKRIVLVLKYFRKNKSNIVHTHFFESGLIGGLVTWLLRVPKRIYTRHHGDEHLFEYPKGLKFDKLINFFHTDIICLSNSHYEQIKKTENPKANIHLLMNIFNPLCINISNEQKSHIKKKYFIDERKFNILVNARWTKPKGIKEIIIGFKEFIIENPHSKIWFFNASGDYQNEIINYLKLLPDEFYERVIFEENILAVYPNMNAFIHVPQRPTYESFGLVYIEAMSFGLPCVFTKSGIAMEVLVEEENSIIVPYNSPLKIKEALERIYNDVNFTENIKENAKKIVNIFSSENHVNNLLEIYK